MDRICRYGTCDRPALPRRIYCKNHPPGTTRTTTRIVDGGVDCVVGGGKRYRGRFGESRRRYKYAVRRKIGGDHLNRRHREDPFED